MKIAKEIYYIVINTFLIALVFLIISHIFIKVYYNIAIPFSYTNLNTNQLQSYSHMSKEDIKDLLNYTWGIGWEYEPWIGFKEKKRSSKFVNVNENGIRLNNINNKVILEDSIWFFGGSTSFGYGVADFETIPAYLEKLSGQKVVNFGRGYYYSAQENLLLTQYLKMGITPKKVIFFDGVNETCDLTTYQANFKLLFEKSQKNYFWDYFEIVKPVIYGYERIKSKIIIKNNKKIDNYNEICKKNGFKLNFSDMIDYNLKERKMICEMYKLDCITFLEPFPYIHVLHKDDNYSENNQKTKNLKEKFKIVKTAFKNNQTISLTNVLQDYPKHAFVDSSHYNSEANEIIAATIVKKIELTK